MQENKRKITFKHIEGYIFMLLACVAYALGTSLFLKNNTIIAGGASGLAIFINKINDKIDVGMMTIAINIPILLLGIRLYGWKFILKCLLTVSILGVLTDLFLKIPPITNDAILASVYGGLCQGVGIGLFVRYEFSSGGTELLGRMVSRWTKVLNIPVSVGILDGIIVLLGAIENPSNMLYALIVIVVSTKISEVMLVGLEKSKLCIIITDKGEEISDVLLKNSPRGVTMLDGKGMYTKAEHNVVLTCVKNRQLTQLKQIVKSVDEHAFIIINDSVEVRGKGFQSLE